MFLLVNPDGLISRVAVMGGSGGNYYMDALRNGADAFVTGDIFYHTAHDIQETPLFLVDAGHHIEVVCRKQLPNGLVNGKKKQLGCNSD